MMNKKKRLLFKLIFILIELLYDAFLGVIIGLAIGLYQKGIYYISHLSQDLFASRDSSSIVILVTSFILLAIVNYFLIKFVPHIEGSGMPNLILGIKKHRNIDWKKGILATIANSYVSCFANLPVGSEGTSIVLAGKIGKMAQDIIHNDDEDDLHLATGAGFGAAYISPLSGIFYIFEEAIKKFKPKLLIRAIVITSLSAYMCFLLNHHQLLELKSYYRPDFNDTYILLLLMIINIPLSCLFYKSMTFFKRFFLKHDNLFIFKYRSFLYFLAALILNYYFFDLMGSGTNIISINFSSLPMYILIIILIFRFLITCIISTGKITGGIVIPIMAIGALSGEIVSSLCTSALNMPNQYYDLIILISMCMVLGIVNTCPLTASALVITSIFNYTGSLTESAIFIPFIFISFVLANAIVKLFKQNDIYETFAEINLEYHLKSMTYGN